MDNASKVSFLALISDFSGERAPSIVQMARDAIGMVELVGTRGDNPVADLKLVGDQIEFSCYLGLHGVLFPEFCLDTDSDTKTPTGEPYTHDLVVRVLRTCFRNSSELLVTDDRLILDEEVFVVDPGTEADLHEAHTT